MEFLRGVDIVLYVWYNIPRGDIMEYKDKEAYERSNIRKWAFGISCAVFMLTALVDVVFVSIPVQEMACKIVMAISALVAIWTEPSRRSLLLAAVSSVSALLFIVPDAYVYNSVYVAVFTFWIWVQALSIVVFAVIKGNLTVKTSPETVILMFQILRFFSIASRYSFAEGEGASDMPFFTASAIGAAVITAACGYLVFKNKITAKNNTKAGKISLLIIVLLMSWVIVDSTFCAANHVFDTAEPVSVSAIIQQKYINKSGKTSNYYLVLESDEGEIKIKVSRREYNNCEAGESLNLKRYGGAFGIPFYLTDNEN